MILVIIREYMVLLLFALLVANNDVKCHPLLIVHKFDSAMAAFNSTGEPQLSTLPTTSNNLDTSIEVAASGTYNPSIATQLPIPDIPSQGQAQNVRKEMPFITKRGSQLMEGNVPFKFVSFDTPNLMAIDIR
jgi:hypothetical protein